jgi:hypothetical protein
MPFSSSRFGGIPGRFAGLRFPYFAVNLDHFVLSAFRRLSSGKQIQRIKNTHKRREAERCQALRAKPSKEDSSLHRERPAIYGLRLRCRDRARAKRFAHRERRVKHKLPYAPRD